ncbi:hypothetical protein B0H15DRAFT_946145 [Mycena belliarum]|uniref:Uncharacterized protein n=1 Tax=Mycena belliarum TaxID=1033014 RepID=A0AAD6UC14_9AGAR|nr:hypothetical protein B0H15DRAFT_946145 [Mycena belliae]
MSSQMSNVAHGQLRSAICSHEGALAFVGQGAYVLLPATAPSHTLVLTLARVHPIFESCIIPAISDAFEFAEAQIARTSAVFVSEARHPQHQAVLTLSYVREVWRGRLPRRSPPRVLAAHMNGSAAALALEYFFAARTSAHRRWRRVLGGALGRNHLAETLRLEAIVRVHTGGGIQRHQQHQEQLEQPETTTMTASSPTHGLLSERKHGALLVGASPMDRAGRCKHAQPPGIPDSMTPYALVLVGSFFKSYAVFPSHSAPNHLAHARLLLATITHNLSSSHRSFPVLVCFGYGLRTGAAKYGSALRRDLSSTQMLASLHTVEDSTAAMMKCRPEREDPRNPGGVLEELAEGTDALASSAV